MTPTCRGILGRAGGSSVPSNELLKFKRSRASIRRGMMDGRDERPRSSKDDRDGCPYERKCKLGKLIKQNAFNQQFVIFEGYVNCHQSVTINS